MKLGRLANDNLHRVLNKLASESLPLRAAFKLKGIINSVNQEYSKYEDVRKGALQRYGKKKRDGTLEVNEDNSVKLTEKNMELFVKELSELSNLDIEVPTISIEDLGNNLQNTYSTEELALLEGILVD